MNLEYKQYLPAGFSPASRVWIYQSSRLFAMSEALHIEDILNHFTANWKSHGDDVKGFATLFFGQFIILIADETAATVGGCSTDSSVRVIKEIEKLFKVSMFDRQSLAFIIKDKVQVIPLAQLQYAAENQFINADTIYFNNLVSTKDELENNWMVPLKNSWLKNKINLIQESNK